MEFRQDDINSRLRFFAELMSYDSECYLWTYSADGILIDTNCRDLILDKMFRSNGCFDYMLNHAEKSTAPLLLGSNLGLIWAAVFEEEEGQLYQIHVLGPAFTQTVTNIEIEKEVSGKLSPKMKRRFLTTMERIPVINSVTFSRRILMMQYCLTGERIHTSDIVMQFEKKDPQKGPGLKQEDSGIYADRIQVHMAEQSMLSMIRNGDMNYKSVLQKSSRFFTGKQKLSNDPLQHAKLGQAQFAALCCNAALEGGLSAETAYTRKDAYIQGIENARSISEIMEISQTMYADYITLVHRQRTNSAYSKAIQSSVDYIENHLNQNISVETIAGRVGYSDYYLSRLFKKETGFSIDEYARNAKIERAKQMLTASNDSIQEIAEALGFNGRNYFSVIFRRITGMPPAAYRKKYQRL